MMLSDTEAQEIQERASGAIFTLRSFDIAALLADRQERIAEAMVQKEREAALAALVRRIGHLWVDAGAVLLRLGL